MDVQIQIFHRSLFRAKTASCSKIVALKAEFIKQSPVDNVLPVMRLGQWLATSRDETEENYFLFSMFNDDVHKIRQPWWHLTGKQGSQQLATDITQIYRATIEQLTSL